MPDQSCLSFLSRSKQLHNSVRSCRELQQFGKFFLFTQTVLYHYCTLTLSTTEWQRFRIHWHIAAVAHQNRELNPALMVVSPVLYR